LILEDQNYEIRPAELLIEPERKTQGTIHTLQAYEIVDEDRDEIISGSRWLRLDLPR
jgi:hypothetical protein